MTRRRWIADRVEGDRAFLTGDHARHLVRVLRAHIGQQFDIATAEGVRRGEIVSISDEEVVFALGERIQEQPVPQITLALAIYKFDRMEWALEKAVELGVERVVPFAGARSEKHLVQAAGKRVERWRRIAMQAAEQSRRAQTPEIADVAALVEVLETPGSRILLAESGERKSLKAALAQRVEDNVVLAIGPEGGWTPSELERFAKHGWIAASLGPSVLRAETAAIAALAIVLSELQ
jgi:16S rRNA (uracil1498-N3)-methyltransferase